MTFLWMVYEIIDRVVVHKKVWGDVTSRDKTRDVRVEMDVMLYPFTWRVNGYNTKSNTIHQFSVV